MDAAAVAHIEAHQNDALHSEVHSEIEGLETRISARAKSSVLAQQQLVRILFNTHKVNVCVCRRTIIGHLNAFVLR